MLLSGLRRLQAEQPRQETLPVPSEAPDLNELLSSSSLFESKNELASFASSMLGEFLKINPEDSKSKVVQQIAEAFEKSPNYTRALFVQALAQRAKTAREMGKRTVAQEYFENWERQIKGQ